MTLPASRRSSPPRTSAGASARLVWGLAALAICLAMIGAGTVVWMLHQNEVRRLGDLSLNASTLGAEQTRAIFNSVRFRVRAVKRELMHRAPAAHWLDHPAELQAALAELDLLNPGRGVVALGAIDPQGRLLALSVTPGAASIDLSDRPYFRALDAGATQVLGDPLYSRALGVHVVPYLEWMTRPRDQRGLILSASIDLPFLERLFRGISGGELGASALFRDDGTFIAGVWPEDAPPPFAEDTGWLLARTPVEGWPLVAVAGVPGDAAWRGLVLPSAMIGGIIGLLSLGLMLLAQIWQHRQRTYAALAQAEEQQQVMLRELNHRIKNNFAAVRAIAAQTLRHSRDLGQFEQAFLGRLDALARASTLSAGAGPEDVEIATLMHDVLEPYGIGSAVRLSGPRVPLPSEAALTLGLVLHELATNAAKHGALSAPEGRVDIVWSRNERGGEQCLVLDWTERGGPKVERPERAGFGHTLIERSVSFDLQGSVALEFPPEGVHCRIELPIVRAG